MLQVYKVDISLGTVFFFNDTATTEIYTLSLHDALPISVQIFDEWVRGRELLRFCQSRLQPGVALFLPSLGGGNRKDRKSTRLNSSHANISYAVFCLKKKKVQLP